ncbi:MAG: NUDIX hydrolase [Actinomycetia bacterium]|nr:NUDIX hydrolase [Actinomycetes bacterium]MCP4084394.1 NUDIX hydrolase [Actinomycetes bacterium]
MGQDESLPPIADDGLRHWTVGGGVIGDASGLLLVRNRRKNGRSDWSPPGGVIDPGETIVGGLTREVQEETGLAVSNWQGPIYRIEVVAPDMGFHLAVEAHQAIQWSGRLEIDDPDGIVEESRFVDVDEGARLLDTGPPWVAEPLMSWVGERWSGCRQFTFRVEGRDSATRVIHRL